MIVDVVVYEYGGCIKAVDVFSGTDKERDKKSLDAISNYLGVRLKSAKALEKWQNKNCDTDKEYVYCFEKEVK